LKGEKHEQRDRKEIVSNPWREAIEETKKWVIGEIERFPILGGRLLKRDNATVSGNAVMVSNPWREAIEDRQEHIFCLHQNSFQSLEGGY